MNCIKDCACCDCENLLTDENLVIINDKNPFNEKRIIINGVKCTKYGHYSLNKDELKDGIKFTDDFLYTSKNKIAKEIFQQVGLF